MIVLNFFPYYSLNLFKELLVRKLRRHVVIGQNVTRPSLFAAGFTFERRSSARGAAAKQI